MIWITQLIAGWGVSTSMKANGLQWQSKAIKGGEDVTNEVSKNHAAFALLDGVTRVAARVQRCLGREGLERLLERNLDRYMRPDDAAERLHPAVCAKRTAAGLADPRSPSLSETAHCIPFGALFAACFLESFSPLISKLRVQQPVRTPQGSVAGEREHTPRPIACLFAGDRALVLRHAVPDVDHQAAAPAGAAQHVQGGVEADPRPVSALHGRALGRAGRGAKGAGGRADSRPGGRAAAGVAAGAAARRHGRRRR